MLRTPFPMNGPLITMTHVCQLWRNVLLSTPDLWTQIDFSLPPSPQQVEHFLRLSKKLPIDIHHSLEHLDDVEPFLSTTLLNTSRLRRLDIRSHLPRFERLLGYFSASAPALESLNINNDFSFTQRTMEFPNNIFGGHLPKLTKLSLHHLQTDLRGFSAPALTWFSLVTNASISVQNLASFFERCPLLEFIHLRSHFTPEPPDLPPKKRVCLTALKELRLDDAACTLLDHLILPKCVKMTLNGQFTTRDFGGHGDPAARIHPSSIDHLPVMRGIAKAVVMPRSCILSGPNGYLRFCTPQENCDNFNAELFTLSPITTSGIRKLWVGAAAIRAFRKETAACIRGVFEVLTKVEDLTILSCKTELIFAALGTKLGDAVLPGLQRLTIYVGYGDLDIAALVQCAKTRKENSRSLREVAITFENEPGADVIQEVEPLREFVERLIRHVGVSPVLKLEGEDCGIW